MIFYKISDVYYLNVTVVNLYEKDVRILEQSFNTRYLVPAGDSYDITSMHSSRQRFNFEAVDATTFRPIKIDGKDSVTVFSSVTPMKRVYYVPTGEVIL
jgi:hypothetical protein